MGQLTKKKGGYTRCIGKDEIALSEIGLDVIEQVEMSVKDFIEECGGLVRWNDDASDYGHRPIIIKVDDPGTPGSLYFFRFDDLNKILKDAVVYPCHQANNLQNTSRPPPILPKGVRVGEDNILRNIRLYSMSNVIDRDFAINGDNMDRQLRKYPGYGGIILRQSGKFYSTLTKLPFVPGMSRLHCNSIRERIYLWKIKGCTFVDDDVASKNTKRTDDVSTTGRNAHVATNRDAQHWKPLLSTRPHRRNRGGQRTKKRN